MILWSFDNFEFHVLWKLSWEFPNVSQERAYVTGLKAANYVIDRLRFGRKVEILQVIFLGFVGLQLNLTYHDATEYWIESLVGLIIIHLVMLQQN